MPNNVDWLNMISIIASIVSVIIGGFAIWLAVKFYEMSSKNSEKLEKSSTDISSATSRLETLFDKLYSDTFSMVKDTMTDMRQHVWRATDLDTDRHKYEKLKNELYKELSEVVKKEIPSGKLDEIERKLHSSINKAVTGSIEKPSEKDILAAIYFLRSKQTQVSVNTISAHLKLNPSDVASALMSMRAEGKFKWEGMKTGIRASQDIELVEPSDHTK
jgi:membrane-associated HD superfamily phosphohydrolase